MKKLILGIFSLIVSYGISMDNANVNSSHETVIVSDFDKSDLFQKTGSKETNHKDLWEFFCFVRRLYMFENVALHRENKGCFLKFAKKIRDNYKTVDDALLASSIIEDHGCGINSLIHSLVSESLENLYEHEPEKVYDNLLQSITAWKSICE